MKNYQHNIILFFSLSFYFLLWILLQPYLGFMLDTDCVAYLKITERVANGDYLKSINGLWSPLNGWLLVPFVKAGYNSWAVAKAMNCFIGGIVLVLSYFLFQRFNTKRLASVLFAFSFPIIIVYFVYFQMFGDVLMLVFVLSYLLLLFSKNFIHSTTKLIVCSILMAIGFYAKAYCLVFLMLHFSVSLYWFYKKQFISKKQLFTKAIIGISVAVLLVLPWSFALHKKYNEWTLTGFAGKMNMSWNINSGKTFKPSIQLLIPPTYQDSPSFWEDPYLTQTNLSSPTSSFHHFVKWLARIIHTLLEAILCFNELSFLSFAIILVGMYFFFFQKNKTENDNNKFNTQLLILTICLLPLAYLMMHIETRYIWLNAILLFILGNILIEKYFTIEGKIKNSLLIILTISFLVFPILQFNNLKFKNKELFERAEIINQQNIHGSFTSNVTDAGRMWVVAYLTKNNFYTIERNDYNESELIAEMKRYHVNYYFYESENNVVAHTMNETYFKKIIKYNNLEIYQFIKQ